MENLGFTDLFIACHVIAFLALILNLGISPHIKKIGNKKVFSLFSYDGFNNNSFRKSQSKIATRGFVKLHKDMFSFLRLNGKIALIFFFISFILFIYLVLTNRALFNENVNLYLGYMYTVVPFVLPYLIECSKRKYIYWLNIYGSFALVLGFMGLLSTILFPITTIAYNRLVIATGEIITVSAAILAITGDTIVKVGKGTRLTPLGKMLTLIFVLGFMVSYASKTQSQKEAQMLINDTKTARIQIEKQSKQLLEQNSAFKELSEKLKDEYIEMIDYLEFTKSGLTNIDTVTVDLLTAAEKQMTELKSHTENLLLLKTQNSKIQDSISKDISNLSNYRNISLDKFSNILTKNNSISDSLRKTRSAFTYEINKLENSLVTKASKQDVKIALEQQQQIFQKAIDNIVKKAINDFLERSMQNRDSVILIRRR